MEKEHIYSTIIDAICAAEMKRPENAGNIPQDNDWHALVVKRAEGYAVAVGFYNGKFWTLGTDKPERPVTVCAYDATVRMENCRNKPIESDEGTIRLCVAVITDWRKEYINALAVTRHKPTQENRQRVEDLERSFPTWMAPGGEDTKKQLIRMLRERMAVNG